MSVHTAHCQWCLKPGSSPRSASVCKMENIKSKGGAEKARIKKRKALETDAAKCAKMGSFFIKTSTRSETTNDDDETGKARC